MWIAPKCALHVVVGLQSAAVQPVYAGWIHDRPLLNENATAVSPTPESASSKQLPNCVASDCGHGAQSTKSFHPATWMFGWLASIATAGSF